MTTAEQRRRTPISSRKMRIWVPAILLAVVTVLAFKGSFFVGRTFSGLSVSVLVHLHAATMALWFVMIFAQALLAMKGRIAVHRVIGRSSYVLAPLIIVSSLVVSHESLNRHGEISDMSARLDVLTWGQTLLYALAWGLAIVYRKKTPVHARFMVSTVFAIGTAVVFRLLLSMVPVINESIERVVVANWLILSLGLGALIFSDWRRGNRRSPFWVMMIGIAVMHIGFWTFTTTAQWRGFIEWFASL